MWFPGVHAAIGGGYRQGGLADCGVRWMTNEARAFGFEFEDHLAQAFRPDPLDTQHNERKGIYLVRGESIRNVDGPVHSSARQRWEATPQTYRKRLLDSVGGDWNRIETVD